MGVTQINKEVLILLFSTLDIRTIEIFYFFSHIEVGEIREDYFYQISGLSQITSEGII